MAETTIRTTVYPWGTQMKVKPFHDFGNNEIWASIKLPNDRSKSPIVRFGFNGTLIGEPLTRAHLIIFAESLLRLGEKASSEGQRLHGRVAKGALMKARNPRTVFRKSRGKLGQGLKRSG